MADDDMQPSRPDPGFFADSDDLTALMQDHRDRPRSGVGCALRDFAVRHWRRVDRQLHRDGRRRRSCGRSAAPPRRTR